MTPTDRILDAASAAGWTGTPLTSTGTITTAVRLTHARHPRVWIEVTELAVRPHFRARVLIDRRETNLLGSAGDVVAILNDPTIVSEDDPVATDRAEHEPCQRGTVGCSVDHRGDTDCRTW